MLFYLIFQYYHFETPCKVEIPSPLKRNERVLSNQALNVGWSLGIMTQESKHGGIYFWLSCSTGDTTSLKVFGTGSRGKSSVRTGAIQLINFLCKWLKTAKQSAIYLKCTCKLSGKKSMNNSNRLSVSFMFICRHLTTVFLDMRLSKKKLPPKRFQNFRQSNIRCRLSGNTW